MDCEDTHGYVYSHRLSCLIEGTEYVRAFEKNNGNYEWNGVAQVKSERLRDGSGHVFQLIEPHLPIPFMLLRTREIDTQNDYEVAQKWVKNGFC